MKLHAFFSTPAASPASAAPLHKAAAALARRGLAFRAATAGVAATEFALILPIMITAYIGVVDVTQAIIARRRVDVLVRTLADLTAQSSAVTTPELSDVLSAAQIVLAPFPADASVNTMQIGSYVLTKQGAGFTTCNDWNYPAGRPLGAPLIPPDVFDPTGPNSQSFVIGQVRYLYNPIMVDSITGQITMTAKPSFMRPRTGDRVLLDNQATNCPT